MAQTPCSSPGFEEKRDNLWQVCDKGKLKPVACISETQERVDEGSSFQNDKFIFSCTKSAENPSTLKLVSIACLNNGLPVAAGEVLSKGTGQLWRCTRVGADLQLTSVGCMDNDGQPAQDGATVVRDNVAYTCTTDAQGSQLTPKACVYGDEQYLPDSDVLVSNLWYKCKATNAGSLALKLAGCIANNTKHAIGQNYTDFWFVYQCQQLAGTAFGVGVGCVERYPNATVKYFKPGDKWLVGAGDFNRYQITCVKQGLVIRRKGIACYYKTNDGQGLLQGGCMRKVGFQILQCTAPTPATPNVRIRVTENPTDADWARLRGTGLVEC